MPFPCCWQGFKISSIKEACQVLHEGHFNSWGLCCLKCWMMPRRLPNSPYPAQRQRLLQSLAYHWLKIRNTVQFDCRKALLSMNIESLLLFTITTTATIIMLLVLHISSSSWSWPANYVNKSSIGCWWASILCNISKAMCNHSNFTVFMMYMRYEISSEFRRKSLYTVKL